MERLEDCIKHLAMFVELVEHDTKNYGKGSVAVVTRDAEMLADSLEYLQQYEDLHE